MAGGTDNNQLKLAAKTRWQWRQQFADDDEDDDNDDNEEHDEYDDNDDDDNEANTATAVRGDNNRGISDGRGHRQQSTKIGSEDTVAVATAIR